MLIHDNSASYPQTNILDYNDKSNSIKVKFVAYVLNLHT